jgi:hypothetical protein
MKPYAACFYGAGPTFVYEFGGSLTSPGVTLLAAKARGLGYDAQCFTFGPVGVAQAFVPIRNALRNRVPLCLYGYSLGVTAITYLQMLYKCDLLLACAGSTLGQNHPINHANTKRSVLWRNPRSVLSGAGPKLGFDVEHDVTAAHLVVQFTVINDVLAEMKRLL